MNSPPVEPRMDTDSGNTANYACLWRENVKGAKA